MRKTDSVKKRLQCIYQCNRCNPVQCVTIADCKEPDMQVSASVLINTLELFPNVSAEWLLRGKGDMILTDETEMRNKIISLEAENRVLREAVGLSSAQSKMTGGVEGRIVLS